jgi:hypothetical protein
MISSQYNDVSRKRGIDYDHQDDGATAPPAVLAICSETSSIFPEAGRAYHLRTFEVDKKLIEADVHLGETELLNAGCCVDNLCGTSEVPS